MTKDQIYGLLDTLPPHLTLDGELAPQPAEDAGDPMHKIRRLHQMAGRYARAYADLRFGWRFVALLVEKGLPFTPAMRRLAPPEIELGYQLILQPGKDPEAFEAFTIAEMPERAAHRNVIDALLLSRDWDVREAIRYTGLTERVFRIYEKLFFNVLDRRHDSIEIGRIVYPHTRLVEMFDDYLDSGATGLGDLLKRSGYNNGMQDVLYFAGHPQGIGLLAANQARDTPERLEALIMANGYLLARNGWLSQRAHSAGFSNARGLIAAAKASGAEAQGGRESPFTLMGASLHQELVAIKRQETNAALTVRRVQTVAKVVAA